jgi:hypothetical protein
MPVGGGGGGDEEKEDAFPFEEEEELWQIRELEWLPLYLKVVLVACSVVLVLDKLKKGRATVICRQWRWLVLKLHAGGMEACRVHIGCLTLVVEFSKGKQGV